MIEPSATAAPSKHARKASPKVGRQRGSLLNCMLSQQSSLRMTDKVTVFIPLFSSLTQSPIKQVAAVAPAHAQREWYILLQGALLRPTAPLARQTNPIA